MDPTGEGQVDHPIVAAHARAARWSVPVAVLGLLLFLPLLVQAGVALVRGGEADARVRDEREKDAAWCAKACPGGTINIDDNCNPNATGAREARERFDARGCRCDVRSTSIWSTGLVDE